MSEDHLEDETIHASRERAATLFRRYWRGNAKLLDRTFGALLALEWLSGIVVALWVSPVTWEGAQPLTHTHVWLSVVLGGLIVLPPLLLAVLKPGEDATRYMIAAAQMLVSSLLIHLTGGRIETHFHIFGSLSFLAFYRDWKVLAIAVTVTTVDHLFRGSMFPLSVYGVAQASPWRTVEHAGWVVFQSGFLIQACRIGKREMQSRAQQTARLELLNERSRLAERAMLELVSSVSIGDLTAKLTPGGNQAAGALGNGLEGMVDNLSRLVRQVQTLGGSVSQTTGQLDNGIRDHVDSLNQQAMLFLDLSGSAHQISESLDQLAHSVKEIESVAGQTADLASQSQQSLTSMDRTMSEMASDSFDIAGRLAVLNEKASNISSVLTTINKVADKTNLLSLNASIEAEKAGESGRGFAVVALEIRRLADQTAVATLDVENMISQMQTAVVAGVRGMDSFVQRVKDGAAEVAEVGEQLRKIIDGVNAMIPYFQAVSQGIESQSGLADEIRQSLDNLSDAMNTSVMSIQESAEVLQELRDSVSVMSSEVRQFRVA